MPYLFKLRHTRKVKQLGQSGLRAQAGWLEAALKLSGWSHQRRVVLVRESPTCVRQVQQIGCHGSLLGKARRRSELVARRSARGYRVFCVSGQSELKG